MNTLLPMSQKEIDEKVKFLSSVKCNHTQHMYIDITGDLIQGTLLARIMYWFALDKNKKSKVRIFKDGYFWIAKQRRDWWDEIRITERQYDKAISELKKKGFVELAKYKFDSMPTIHIRPNYDNINTATEKWENELRKTIIEEYQDELQKSKNGNYTKCKTGIAQDVTLLTKITNRDYNTKNTKTKYAFPSEKCDTPSDKFSREYISKAINNIMVLQFGMDENSNKSRELTNIILYFFEQYEKRFAKKHPNIAFISYVNIIKEYLHPFGDNMAYIDDSETYQALIDKYFEENYNAQGNYDKEVNLSLSHFMSGEIREHLCNRNGVLWERCDD